MFRVEKIIEGVELDPPQPLGSGEYLIYIVLKERIEENREALSQGANPKWLIPIRSDEVPPWKLYPTKKAAEEALLPHYKRELEERRKELEEEEARLREIEARIVKRKAQESAEKRLTRYP